MSVYGVIAGIGAGFRVVTALKNNDVGKEIDKPTEKNDNKIVDKFEKGDETVDKVIVPKVPGCNEKQDQAWYENAVVQIVKDFESGKFKGEIGRGDIEAEKNALEAKEARGETLSATEKAALNAYNYLLTIPGAFKQVATAAGGDQNSISQTDAIAAKEKLPALKFDQPMKEGDYTPSDWYGKVRSNGKTHQGTDYAADEGTPVYAAENGTVTKVVHYEGNDHPNYNGATAYGTYIEVTHRDGTVTRYSHLQHNGVKVSPGEPVYKGQEIGAVGNTGYSTGSHLDFEIQDKNGNRVNPKNYGIA